MFNIQRTMFNAQFNVQYSTEIVQYQFAVQVSDTTMLIIDQKLAQ